MTTTNPAQTACLGDPNEKMTTMVDPDERRPQRMRRRQRRGGRLWQLPQASIQEYAQWIQTKPLSDQSIAEQKFLWKYQRRLLVRRNKLPTERMRDYIGRLEQKPDKSAVEAQLVQQFHRRVARRRERVRGRQVGVAPPIFWRRNNNNANANKLQQTSPTPQQQEQGNQQHQQTPGESSSGVLNMSSLRESMGKLGLSTDRLREAAMDDAE